MELVPVLIISLGASILTEILKLFPVLATTDERKRAVAFIVALVLALIYLPSAVEITDAVGFVLGVMSFTFAIFKGIVQPVEGAVVTTYRKLAKAKEVQ